MASWSTPGSLVQMRPQERTGNVCVAQYYVQHPIHAQAHIGRGDMADPVRLGDHAGVLAAQRSSFEHAQQAYEQFFGLMTRLDLASGLRQSESQTKLKAAFDDFCSTYFDNLENLKVAEVAERNPKEKVNLHLYCCLL
jgi:hypothetical protein